jgi:ketosteroid isomerase-like protein
MSGGSDKDDTDVEEVVELERLRYDAVVAGDFDAFAAVCHPDLVYTHSTGVTDTLESYVAKCRDGYYDYHRIDHPVTKVVLHGDVALVLGEMNADITAGGARKQLRNSCLAVWVRAGETWKLIGYQPTPRA